MTPEPTTKIKAVYNAKFGQWRLCHNALCGWGETSIVATILTTDDPAADEAWAREMERRFNGGGL